MTADLLRDILYDAVVLGAGVACLVRAPAFPRERRAWLLIGIAILLWGAAEVYWTAFIEGNANAPYPSPADVLYLAFYPFAAAGLAMLVRARAHEINWRLWMDGVIATLGTAALGTAFVFDFIADQTSGTTLQTTTTLAYPLGDIALVAMVAGVIALTGWQPGRTWSLLLGGLVAMAAADITFTLQTVDGGASAEWIDLIYMVAAVCLAAAVWQPAEAAQITSPGDRGRRELIVPALFATVMIGLFGMQYYNSTSSLSTVLWAGTMVAVIVRLAMSDRENKALLTQVQTDPLTGLANRGRMQVDLERRCLAATDEHPAALLFLDLNGFKHLNDTLGHPAGDELLIVLGRALDEAIGKNGVAYRVGGDEFCVLLTCPEDRFDEVTRDAAQALTAQGKGFAISAAWGAAVIPREATTPSEALQLADVRMYAQKESRRLAQDEPLVPPAEPAPQPHAAGEASSRLGG